MDELWDSIFEKGRELRFPLAPVVRAEFERRYGGDSEMSSEVD
jgi:hypothetical protein